MTTYFDLMQERTSGQSYTPAPNWDLLEFMFEPDPFPDIIVEERQPTAAEVLMFRGLAARGRA